MDALHPRIGQVEENVYRDMDEVGKLHQLLHITDTQIQVLQPGNSHENMQGNLGT